MSPHHLIELNKRIEMKILAGIYRMKLQHELNRKHAYMPIIMYILKHSIQDIYYSFILEAATNSSYHTTHSQSYTSYFVECRGV